MIDKTFVVAISAVICSLAETKGSPHSLIVIAAEQAGLAHDRAMSIVEVLEDADLVTMELDYVRLTAKGERLAASIQGELDRAAAGQKGGC
jgi:predicted transcriptional regulator